MFESVNVHDPTLFSSLVSISSIISVVMLYYCLLCRGDEKTLQNIDVFQRKEAETFVRVGAETPDDKKEDPSPPLAVVGLPLRLAPTSLSSSSSFSSNALKGAKNGNNKARTARR